MSQIRTIRKEYKPFKYQWSFDLMKEQQHAHWLADEVGDLTRDCNEFKLHAKPHELHGIEFLLASFVAYESEVECYWIGRMWPRFKAPELRGLFTTIGASEHVHIEGYDKFLTAWGSDLSKYKQFFEDPTFKERRALIDQALMGENDIQSIATMALIEGVALFAQFAYLQSFVKHGLLMQLDNLIEWSSRDEGSIHLRAAAGIYSELEREGECLDRNWWFNQCHIFFQQEMLIVDEMFKYGNPRGITKKDLIEFIKHRVNYVSEWLGFDPVFEIENIIVQDEFYKDHHVPVDRDKFSSRNTEYSKGLDFSNVWAY